MGFGFLVGVQLARGLGAEGYGIYGVVMSVVALLSVPTQFGLPQLVTREIAVAHSRSDWSHAARVLSWSLSWSLGISAVAAVVAISWLAWVGGISGPLAQTLLAGMVLVPVVAMLSLHSAALRGMQRLVIGQLPEIALRPALHSLLLFVAPLVLPHLSPAVAIWLGAAASALALVHVRWLYIRTLPNEARATVHAPAGRQWWSSALPMAMTEGMRLLQSHALIFILGLMVTLSDVGVFRMAASTSVLILMPLSLFNIIGMPMIASLHANGQQARLRRLLGAMALGMFGGVLLLSLPFFVAGDYLLGRVFGSEFVAGNSPLVLLCLAGLVNAAFGLNAALLNMTGHQNRVTRASAVSLTLLLLSAPLLVQTHGLTGAAYANLGSVAVWNFLMWRDCLRLLGLDTGAWSLGRA